MQQQTKEKMSDSVRVGELAFAKGYDPPPLLFHRHPSSVFPPAAPPAVVTPVRDGETGIETGTEVVALWFYVVAVFLFFLLLVILLGLYVVRAPAVDRCPPAATTLRSSHWSHDNAHPPPSPPVCTGSSANGDDPVFRPTRNGEQKRSDLLLGTGKVARMLPGLLHTKSGWLSFTTTSRPNAFGGLVTHQTPPPPPDTISEATALFGKPRAATSPSMPPSSPPSSEKSNVLQIFVGFGANYYGTSNELLTCNNDVRAVHTFWKQSIANPTGKQAEFILSDEPGTRSEAKPTRQNWLTTIARVQQLAHEQDQAGGCTEVLYMSSSHGFFQKSSNPDELDGTSECFVTAEGSQTGLVWDYEIAQQFLQPLPASVHVLAIFDSCNSGSVMNLPWMYNRLSKSCNQDSHNTGIRASVWAISGCRDEQTSAAGSTSHALSVLTAHLLPLLSLVFRTVASGTTLPAITVATFYLQLLISLRKRNEHQIPLLTVSHQRLVDLPFY